MFSKFQPTLLIGSILASYAAPALSDDRQQTAAPELIVVTASRREMPLDQIGSSISVLTSEALEAGQFNFVADALQSVPGATLNENGPFGGIAYVRIRGAVADQTVVLVDGVQVNDASATGGGYNFANLTPFDIDRIEVLRGPQSVMYGSDAIGGVINILTKTGGGDTQVSYFLEGGSFGTIRGGASVTGGDRLTYRLSASGIDSKGISKADAHDGNSEKDGYSNLTLSGKVAMAFTDGVRAEATLRYADSSADIDGFAFTGGAFRLADTAEVSKTDEYVAAFRLMADLLDGKLQNTVSAEYAKTDRVSLLDGAETYTATGERLNFDYLGLLKMTDTVSVSGGLQHEEVKSAGSADASFSIDSAFSELAFTPGKALTVTAGIRYDDHEQYGGTTTGRVTAAYVNETTGTKLRANWGEGFKAPSVYQLTYICTFCGLSAPNADLNAERARAWEAGIDQSLLDDRLSLSATYFDMKARNLIVFTYTAGYANVDRSRQKGIELEAGIDLTDRVSLSGNYVYTDAKDLGTGQKLIRQPRHMAYGLLQVGLSDKLNTALSVLYNGKETDWDGTVLDSWTRLDLKASYALSEAVELYGRIDNLLDRHYQQVPGYGTPGLSAFAGIRGRF